VILRTLPYQANCKVISLLPGTLRTNGTIRETKLRGHWPKKGNWQGFPVQATR
jgi:hypothetical protein